MSVTATRTPADSESALTPTQWRSQRRNKSSVKTFYALKATKLPSYISTISYFLSCLWLFQPHPKLRASALWRPQNIPNKQPQTHWSFNSLVSSFQISDCRQWILSSGNCTLNMWMKKDVTLFLDFSLLALPQRGKPGCNTIKLSPTSVTESQPRWATAPLL